MNSEKRTCISTSRVNPNAMNRFRDTMTWLVSTLALASFALCAAQGHDMKPVDGMKAVAFMVGDWSGKHEFNNGMKLDVVAKIHEAVNGRYLEDDFVTTLGDGRKSDVRHLLTFDPKIRKYRAWWFNNTSFEPSELVGDFVDGKLVLESKASGPGPAIRATYEKVGDDKLGYKVEAKIGGNWQELLHSVFDRSKT